MKKIFLLPAAILLTLTTYSQVSTDFRSGGEYIFSWGNIDGALPDADNVVRFTAFINQQMQYHIDVGKYTGSYTGLGIRNVGFIHTFGDTLKIKQRAYALGLPVALKAGNMEKGVYFAAGAEMELFFHYKEKTFLHGEKKKNSEWFSDRTDLFHPSIFAEIGLGHGIYLRYRYYLTDFLRKKDVVFPGNIQLPYDNSPSRLMYISVGTIFSKKKFRESMPPIRKTSNTMASGSVSGILYDL